MIIIGITRNKASARFEKKAVEKYPEALLTPFLSASTAIYRDEVELIIPKTTANTAANSSAIGYKPYSSSPNLSIKNGVSRRVIPAERRCSVIPQKKLKKYVL